jgi:signal transduction histidine kinase
LKKGESPDNLFTLEELIKDVQNANVEARRIMANLRPSILDDIGIVPALSWLSRETEKAYPGTSVQIAAALGDKDVPDELKIVLFRVVQESVTNAIKDGKSSRIQVGLVRQDGWLRLEVEDNGKGFDAGKLVKSETQGIGLNSMEQRINSTRGIFSLSSVPGKGTKVKAEWKIG